MKESLKLFFSFIALCFGLNFVYFGLLSNLFDLRIIIATLVAKTLHTFLLWNTSIDGFTILLNSKSIINVINECTGIFSMSIFVSIVLVFDTTLRNKVWGLVVGVPVLFGLAILRLSLTTLLVVKYPTMLHLMHDYLFQIFLLVFVVALFVVWHDIVIEKKHNLRKYTVLFGEFIGLTTMLFLVWTQIAVQYAKLILETTALLLSNVSINYYNESQLFLMGMITTLPSFVSLIAITPQIRWKKKLGIIGIGIGLIFVFRIFLELSYIFYESNQSILTDFVVSFLSGPVRIILPLGIWIGFLYKEKVILIHH